MSEALLEARPARASGRQGLAQTLQSGFDDLQLALSALTAHKMRSALTLLGLVIGVFTVVIMMALTTGLQSAIDKGMGGLGADVFQIQKWPSGLNFGPMSPEILKRKPLTLPQTLALRELLPQAKQVGAEVWDNGKEVTGEFGVQQGVQVGGGTAEFFTNNSLPVGRGRSFLEGEATSASRVVVIGAGVVDALFPDGQQPLGAKVRLGRLDLEVIGVLERQGGSPMAGNIDNIVAIPITLFFELYGTGRSVNITVMAKEHADMHRLMDLSVSAFRRIRGLDANVENDFDMYSNESMRATVDELTSKVQYFMIGICCLSLLVGGIGVMNIMLVAVAERTREIGLRKALGARQARVLTQFVVEAVLLALFGGIIGVLLGYAGSAMARFAFELPTAVPAWAVALSLAVSCTIGLVFGIYPAWRASKLDPAVALRDE